ncbi:MAG: hypothetical protein DRP35_06650 [Candidatus Zixiibacteriota bacterium]|nr:MAG: hypothetical protein DRP35_06650 [candidate division Zixibacteria bacterium]
MKGQENKVKSKLKNESKHAIMIVDDDELILKSLNRLFADEPYRVYIFDNVEVALDSLEERDYSIVISDYSMPIMSGAYFLEKIKDKSPNSIRILLTGVSESASTPDQVAKNILHCHKFVTKPWDDYKLLELINICIAIHEKKPSKIKSI